MINKNTNGFFNFLNIHSCQSQSYVLDRKSDNTELYELIYSWLRKYITKYQP